MGRGPNQPSNATAARQAENGESGRGGLKTISDGRDVAIKAPLDTVAKDAETGEVLLTPMLSSTSSDDFRSSDGVLVLLTRVALHPSPLLPWSRVPADHYLNKMSTY